MRLVGAEILKLRRRRGTMIWTALLTIGSVADHGDRPARAARCQPGQARPAGGTENLKNLAFLLGGLGTVAAILIGSAAGTQDASAGVFRDLVVTGRPRRTLIRRALSRARWPCSDRCSWSRMRSASSSTYAFAGDRPGPTGSEVGHYAAYLALIGAVNIGVAIGLAAFASSRVVVGVLIAWNAIVSHILISIHASAARASSSTWRRRNTSCPAASTTPRSSCPAATALFVLAAWVLVFQAAGRWWTERRDA